MYGSVRGAEGNLRPYRDPRFFACPIGRDGGRFHQLRRPVYSPGRLSRPAKMWLIVRLYPSYLACLKLRFRSTVGLHVSILHLIKRHGEITVSRTVVSRYFLKNKRLRT